LRYDNLSTVHVKKRNESDIVFRRKLWMEPMVIIYKIDIIAQIEMLQ
jgi:hypothetical protein